MTEPTVVYASTDESPNDILKRIGVETLRDSDRPRWYYKGKTVFRPAHPTSWEEDLLEHFNIQIVYQDKNQLSLSI